MIHTSFFQLEEGKGLGTPWENARLRQEGEDWKDGGVFQMERRIFYNGRITTMDRRTPQAEAVCVEDHRIVAVGSTEEILLQTGRAGVSRIDLEGAFVYPGLTDNHLHLMGHGMKLSMLDLSGATSKASLLRKVEECARMTPEGKWVLGLNWNENRFPLPEPPTLAELDAVSPDRPVLLTRVCHHVQAVNSKACQVAGVSRDTPDPKDGKLGRDVHGNLNGLIFENASRPFLDALPARTLDELRGFARKGAADALSKGLTCVHTDDLRSAGSVDTLLAIYRGWVEEGTALRTHHLLYHPFLDQFREAGWKGGDGDPWIRFGAVKIFADGSLGGRTALLSRPYADDPATRGLAVHSRVELEERVRQARAAGMAVAIHAIGDEAAERVIQVLKACPPGSTIPDRLIHGQVLREDQIRQLCRLPVAVDIQPRFVVSDFPWVRERLPEELHRYAYAWKTLIESGVPVGGGSDAPIEPLDPLLGIHAAVTRRSPEMNGHPGYSPEQRLTPYTALRLFTLGGAQTAGEARERGTILPGKFADLSIFDRDLLDPEPASLLEAKALMTVVNGQIAWWA